MKTKRATVGDLLLLAVAVGICGVVLHSLLRNTLESDPDPEPRQLSPAALTFVEALSQARQDRDRREVINLARQRVDPSISTPVVFLEPNRESPRPPRRPDALDPWVQLSARPAYPGCSPGWCCCGLCLPPLRPWH